MLVYALRDLGLTTGTIGLLFSIGSLGTLAAAVTAATLLMALAPKEAAIPLIVASKFVLSFGGTSTT